MVKPGWTIALILLGFTCSSPAQDSGTPPAQKSKSAAAGTQNPVYRLEVRRVPLDIVVTDKQGHSVRGLTKDDFVVKEDGKKQRVLTFGFEDGSGPGFVPPKLPPPPVNTFRNMPTTPERGPLYVLYYDMVNTRQEDQMAFRRQLLEFVDHAAAGTRMALFANMAGLHLVQGFTSDHELLRTAITQKGPGPHLPDVFLYPENYGRADAGAALSNLRFLAEYLGGLPGRKNLLWMSDNFPIPVGPRLTGSTGGGGGSPGNPAGRATLGGPDVVDLSELLRDAIKHTYSALMRSQVALYLVDLRGVGAGNESLILGGGDMITDYQSEDSIAAATGGKAYYSDNKVNLLLDQAVDHGATYYTLSYSPTNTNYDGSERSIEVTLNKKGNYTLNYRRLYYGVPDDEAPKPKKNEVLQARFVTAKIADTLYANIEHGAPMVHDLLFSAYLKTEGPPATATADQMVQLEDSPAYFRTRRKNHPLKPLPPAKLQKYMIDYGVVDPLLKAAARSKGAPAVLEFAAAAYDPDGRLLNSILNDGVASSTPGATPKSDALFHAIQELEVPPGAAWIRLAVRDTLTDRTGTLEVPLPLKPDSPAQAMNQNRDQGSGNRDQ